MNLIDTFYKITDARDITGAIEFQKALAARLIIKDIKLDIRSICAFDISYEKTTRKNFAVAVLMSYPDLKIIENVHFVQDAVFPYIPGLLAFREGHAIIELFNELKSRPDILLFDGHGIAHPRRAGIATMIGILLNMPSIGCGKTRLIGEFDEPAIAKGSIAKLFKNGIEIGLVLRTRLGVKPVFVSIGHLIGLNTAAQIVLACCDKYSLPEPIRAAHRFANELRFKDKACN